MTQQNCKTSTPKTTTGKCLNAAKDPSANASQTTYIDEREAHQPSNQPAMQPASHSTNQPGSQPRNQQIKRTTPRTKVLFSARAGKWSVQQVVWQVGETKGKVYINASGIIAPFLTT
jgi:hypothetical protein